MSYQVLARKWRPRTFSEMVGQGHVVRALSNALDSDRLHHAFLFTGTRGVGKTTLARIFAKSLNCEVAVSSTPCGQCSACREIDEGRFVDLLELDAASHTGIDNMREVLDNAQYAPARGRYKVYLIDEVHMLSKPAFNSMLKTLEEPPPHVKFILATTDPQKIPVTVLSRCLHFNLKCLSVELISAQLKHILSEEGIESEPNALVTISNAADGSLRDALSLLDQAIAYGGDKLSDADVRAMLGSTEQGHVIELLYALAKNDADAVLERIRLLAEHVSDFAGLLAELLSCLHKVALAQVAPKALDDSLTEREDILRLSKMIPPEDVQLFYQIALMGRRDLPLACDPRGGFEMVLLRMLAFRPVNVEPIKEGESDRQSTTASGLRNPQIPKAMPPGEIAASAVRPLSRNTAKQGGGEDWAQIADALKLSGLSQQLAVNCELARHENDAIHLILDPSHAHLRNKSIEERLQQALQQYYGAPVKLVISTGSPEQATPALIQARQQSARQAAAVQAIHKDANLKTLCETFNARINLDSIEAGD